MPTDIDYQRIADSLLSAYRTGEPVSPPRESLPDLDLDGAYRIQMLQEAAFRGEGRKVVGRKIGLTSEAMQKQLGVDSPDFGFFTDDLVFTPGVAIDVGRFISPKVEPELAFTLGTDLPAEVTLEQVRDSVESVHLAVEIIDSRIRDWNIRLVDTVADNASCGAVIIDPAPVNVALADLADVRADMSVSGELFGGGTGRDVMGDPLAPLVWLAGILGAQGVPLKAGQTILTGSFCAAAPVLSSQRIDVDYGPFGTLSASFA